MPRTVESAVRRRALGEAVWRVIRREGVQAASVRAVAREAGVSAGSLRHFFSTQDELLAFAMQLVIERVVSRVEALPAHGSPRERVEAVLAELLPLDDERRAEMQVWLAFSGRALADPALRRLREEGDRRLLDACRGMLGWLISGGLGRPELDVELEAERLQAVLDGVALHGVLRPGEVTPQRMRAVLALHLDDLGRP